MRTLNRNKQKFHYYLYRGKTELIDEDGFRTGEEILSYSPVQSCYGNISAGSGDAQAALFGSNIAYERVILLDDINCPIDENSLLCVDIEPQAYSANETPTHDYRVKAVAKSLNVFAIAISKETPDEN